MEAVVAVYSDWGIGAQGTQPLVVPADRVRFRELTTGHAVIVGRKTLEDFPGGKPLKNRHNIVITRQSITIDGAEVVHGMEEALEKSKAHDRCFVIGQQLIKRQKIRNTRLSGVWQHIVSKLGCPKTGKCRSRDKSYCSNNNF